MWPNRVFGVQFRNISIDEEGKYYWNKEVVDFETLKSRIRSLAADPEPPALNIRADAALKYQKVIDVVDYVKGQNLTRISLGTRQD